MSINPHFFYLPQEPRDIWRAGTDVTIIISLFIIWKL